MRTFLPPFCPTPLLPFPAGDGEFSAGCGLQEAAAGGSAPAELRRPELPRGPGAQPGPAQPRPAAGAAAQPDRSVPGNHPLTGPPGMSWQLRAEEETRTGTNTTSGWL